MLWRFKNVLTDFWKIWKVNGKIQYFWMDCVKWFVNMPKIISKFTSNIVRIWLIKVLLWSYWGNIANCNCCIFTAFFLQFYCIFIAIIAYLLWLLHFIAIIAFLLLLLHFYCYYYIFIAIIAFLLQLLHFNCNKNSIMQMSGVAITIFYTATFDDKSLFAFFFQEWIEWKIIQINFFKSKLQYRTYFLHRCKRKLEIYLGFFSTSWRKTYLHFW